MSKSTSKYWVGVSIVALAASAVSAAPVVGNPSNDTSLTPALGVSVGQLMVNSAGNAWTGQIDPSIYQAYDSGLTNQLPILVAEVSSQTPNGSNNAVFAQPNSGLSLNGGSITGGTNIGGIGSQTPNTTNYTGGFNAFDFYSTPTQAQPNPIYQNGLNTGIVVFQPTPYALYGTNTPLTDATVTLNTFYLDQNFALGTKLDVFEVNPAVASDPSTITYNTLANFVAVPEPASASLLGIGIVVALHRRRRA